MDVINIGRGWHTPSVLVEMLSKAWPEWTFNNKQPHTLSAMGSLFMTQLWMNPNWKYPIWLINKLRNSLPMDGEGDETQRKKNWKFLLVYLEGSFVNKIWCKPFPFTSGKVVCQLVRVPYIISKVLLSFFYLYCSFFHIWRVSDLKNIWRFFMQTQGLSFNPSAIFDRLHSSLLVSWQVPQITEGSIKDRPFFCTELSPGFTLITYSIKDRLF